MMEEEEGIELENLLGEEQHSECGGEDEGDSSDYSEDYRPRSRRGSGDGGSGACGNVISLLVAVLLIVSFFGVAFGVLKVFSKGGENAFAWPDHDDDEEEEHHHGHKTPELTCVDLDCRHFGYRAGNLLCDNEIPNFDHCTFDIPICVSGASPEFVVTSEELVFDFRSQENNKQTVTPPADSNNLSTTRPNCELSFTPRAITMQEDIHSFMVLGKNGEVAYINSKNKTCLAASDTYNDAIDLFSIEDNLFVLQSSLSFSIEEKEKETPILHITQLGNKSPIQGSQEQADWAIKLEGRRNIGKINAFTLITNSEEVENKGSFALAFENSTDGHSFIITDCWIPWNTKFSATMAKRIKLHCTGDVFDSEMNSVIQMDYDESGSLFVMSSSLLNIFDANGKLIQKDIALPSNNIKGATFHACHLFVSQSASKLAQIQRYDFLTKGDCKDKLQNQDEVCTDVGGICNNFEGDIETNCNDGLDNDCDGFVDQDDQDCSKHHHHDD